MTRAAPRLVVLAGLPGSGKSTLARGLAAALGAHVLDKDRVRAALFGPARVRYERAQDDLVMGCLFTAASELLGARADECVLIDGRTFTAPGQLEALRLWARGIGVEPRVIECRCSPQVAAARVASGAHAAADRSAELVLRLAREAVELEPPVFTVDSEGQAPEVVLELALSHLRSLS